MQCVADRVFTHNGKTIFSVSAYYSQGGPVPGTTVTGKTVQFTRRCTLGYTTMNPGEEVIVKEERENETDIIAFTMIYTVPNGAFEPVSDGTDPMKKFIDIKESKPAWVWPPRAASDPLTPYGADEALLVSINKDRRKPLEISCIDSSSTHSIGQSPFEHYKEVEANLPQGQFTVSLKERALANIQNIPNARPEISCGIETMKGALEFLWSEREGRPVIISASFIRWAYDQFRNEHAGGRWDHLSSTNSNHLMMAIQKYGACEEKFMGPSGTSPSGAAISDAAKRKALVPRKVTFFERGDPNASESHPQYLWRLIAHELILGRPIFVQGLIPTIARRGSKQLDKVGNHTHLWMGISHTENKLYLPVLEVMEVQGRDVGDQGFFTMPANDLRRLHSQAVEAWSLSLE